MIAEKYMRNKYTDIEILSLFENYEITKLDINRMYRYIEKYTKEDAVDIDDDHSIISVFNENIIICNTIYYTNYK